MRIFSKSHKLSIWMLGFLFLTVTIILGIFSPMVFRNLLNQSASAYENVQSLYSLETVTTYTELTTEDLSKIQHLRESQKNIEKNKKGRVTLGIGVLNNL